MSVSFYTELYYLRTKEEILENKKLIQELHHKIDYLILQQSFIIDVIRNLFSDDGDEDNENFGSNEINVDNNSQNTSQNTYNNGKNELENEEEKKSNK